MQARVHISLKPGVLDPQGQAVESALKRLGFNGVASVRQGKVIDLDLKATDKAAAKAEVTKMCESLLANTVMESYAIEILG
ncbi:MAG: phosphoribosylformylglycinamidine synthase subunit PurS [Alphaproteobacteria bacterium]|nr:phosphoribosylformylglycinamidine synthase subunit PurS [Alphaproteobacteria bacterium]